MMIAVVALGLAVLMVCVEQIKPGRPWPKVPGWLIRALFLNGFQIGIVFISGIAWDRWMLRHRVWSSENLGIIGGAFAGYSAITFVYYWWHRWRHQSAFLWRWLHQVHHSPQRIEVITSFYKHPFEIVLNGILSSAILYLLVGVGPAAASIAVLMTALAELFYHWNVSTPHWLGYVIRRPESHCIHHQEGVHAYNYADLPLWDILFGTYRNPARWNDRCGFGPRGERRLREMLLGKEIKMIDVVE